MMKEKCEKLFHVGEVYYTIFIILIFLISLFIIGLTVILRVGWLLILIVTLAFALVNVFSFISYRIYQKSAYYVEIKEEKILLYVTGNCLEKNISDCKRIIRTGFEIFLFFNDGVIRLCKFYGCPGVTDCVSKENFPNIK